VKVNLAKSAGFCFGVKRALKIAISLAESGKDIEMLGDIVHNECVVKEIQSAGIKKISKLNCGKGKTLLIRAHGACNNLIEHANTLGYKIVDATCPMVKEIHRITIEMDKKGFTIIIIGDKKHDEVQGIAGQIKKRVIIIDKLENIPYEKIKIIRKACIVVQSTQNLEKVLRITEALKQHIPELKFFNTICVPTRMKQQEIKTMPLKNDLMIIIGSKNSANTRRLYEISKSLNKRSYWVQSKKEINPAWFKGVRKVGITSGSSTPDVTTKEIIAFIKQSNLLT